MYFLLLFLFLLPLFCLHSHHDYGYKDQDCRLEKNKNWDQYKKKCHYFAIIFLLYYYLRVRNSRTVGSSCRLVWVWIIWCRWGLSLFLLVLICVDLFWVRITNRTQWIIFSISVSSLFRILCFCFFIILFCSLLILFFILFLLLLILNQCIRICLIYSLTFLFSYLGLERLSFREFLCVTRAEIPITRICQFTRNPLLLYKVALIIWTKETITILETYTCAEGITIEGNTRVYYLFYEPTIVIWSELTCVIRQSIRFGQENPC